MPRQKLINSGSHFLCLLSKSVLLFCSCIFRNSLKFSGAPEDSSSSILSKDDFSLVFLYMGDISEFVAALDFFFFFFFFGTFVMFLSGVLLSMSFSKCKVTLSFCDCSNCFFMDLLPFSKHT